MSIVIKEIVVRTKVEKTVYRPEGLPEVETGITG